MTAKDALRNLIEGLSEEEAARWLARMKPSDDQPVITTFEEAQKRPLIVERANPAGLLAYLDWLRSQPPSMSEEEWAEFTKAFDSHRPHRPLFADEIHPPR